MLCKARLMILACLFLVQMLAPHAVRGQGVEDVTIMVLPFEINAEDPELDYLRQGLPELLRARLSEMGFEVVDEERVMKILENQEVEYLDLATSRDMALLGNADYSVYGSFNQVGDSISIDARLVEAFGLKPPKPLFVVKEGIINVLPAIEELAENVRLELVKKQRIAEIQVQGLEVLEEDVVLMRLKMQEGDVYDPKVLDEEVRRIFDTGYFDDVRVAMDELPDGIRLVFEVDEKPRIQAVDVLGNEEIDDDEILEVMSTKAGSVLNPKVLSDDLSKVRQLYREEGFYKAEVDYQLEEGGANQARLNITVEEGEELYIEEIVIKGAESLDADDLKDEMALSERGFLSWFTGSGVLHEELLTRDAAAIEAYYANRGFLEAKVVQPDVIFEEKGIKVVFQVQEGPRYKVEDVTIGGDILVDKERLFEVISLDDLAEEEEYLDRSKLRDDVQALAEFYADYGYAFAEADYVLDVDKENLLVGVSYNLYKHRKVYIRRLLITGNTDTRDNVIRREMRLSDGEVFRSSALERSTERLEKTGYFEQVSIEPVRTENQDEMDLLVKVKEQSTGELSGGVGYSTFTRFYVTSSITERNLFGKGYKISLGTSLGGSSNSFNFSFVNPNVYDTPLAFSTNLYLQTADFGDFSKDTIGGVVGLGYPVGEYTSVGISYRLDRYRVHEVDDNAADAIEEAEGTNWSSAMALSATRDTLNSRVDPTDGSKNTLSIEYAGGILMGDDDFIKYIYDTSQYYPLPWFSHVFHFHGQAGIVTKNLSDDEVPVFERFFLGGMNSIRGYTHGRIAPYDEETGDRIGGTKQFFANFEYIFPLYTEFGLKGLVFFDAGDAFTEYEEFDIKKSVGAGIRWLSPMGLLRLEYGYALDEIREQGNRGKFEFSVGQSF